MLWSYTYFNNGESFCCLLSNTFILLSSWRQNIGNLDVVETKEEKQNENILTPKLLNFEFIYENKIFLFIRNHTKATVYMPCIMYKYKIGLLTQSDQIPFCVFLIALSCAAPRWMQWLTAFMLNCGGQLLQQHRNGSNSSTFETGYNTPSGRTPGLIPPLQHSGNPHGCKHVHINLWLWQKHNNHTIKRFDFVGQFKS